MNIPQVNLDPQAIFSFAFGAVATIAALYGVGKLLAIFVANWSIAHTRKHHPEDIDEPMFYGKTH